MHNEKWANTIARLQTRKFVSFFIFTFLYILLSEINRIREVNIDGIENIIICHVPIF